MALAADAGGSGKSCGVFAFCLAEGWSGPRLASDPLARFAQAPRWKEGIENPEIIKSVRSAPFGHTYPIQPRLPFVRSPCLDTSPAYPRCRSSTPVSYEPTHGVGVSAHRVDGFRLERQIPEALQASASSALSLLADLRAGTPVGLARHPGERVGFARLDSHDGLPLAYEPGFRFVKGREGFGDVIVPGEAFLVQQGPQ